MSNFLDQLASQINNQFSVGENSNRTLDSVINGQNQKYGSLGDISKKIDQSAQRKYLEQGFLRKDSYNSDPKQLEILMQEPSATVLVKKKMFSSVGDNFRPDFMDADEKLYYKAMKILFQNKCAQISAFEKLSKIQKITSAVGNIDAQLMPIIITLSDTISSGMESSSLFGLFGGSNKFNNTDLGTFAKAVDRLRAVYAYNESANTTSWITDSTNLFNSQLGEGSGVLEITNFTKISTTTSVNIDSGGIFSLQIEDPYQMMLITEYDIERAIADASNSYYNHKVFQFSKDAIDQTIADTKNKLNQIRESRKASPLSFKINPDTLLSKRVRVMVDRIGEELVFDYDGAKNLFAGIGGTDGGVSVSKEYLRGGEILGFDGLDNIASKTYGPDNNLRPLSPESELSIFNRLISAIFNKITLEANSRNAVVSANKNTNYTRRKLRFNFLGNTIIQPMDTVHVYMNSKSRYDGKLLSGLDNMFSGVGILQNLNNTVVDFKNSLDTLFNPAGSVPIQIEKSIYVGQEFPNYLWSLVRSMFITEKEGTHVFAGVVESANDSYSDGSFSVSVSGKDNTFYFSQGKINFKPGIDGFNGAIFDPMTPFKSSFDTVSTNGGKQELLEENKYLLGNTGKESLLKYKSGPLAGEKFKEANYVFDTSVDPISKLNTKVFHAPDGLVYKWKEGIGVFTQFGSSLAINDANKTGNINTYKEPFAGLDIMNVLSLLIVGVPYNFATYFAATQNPTKFGNDPQSRQNAANSFFESLRNDLSKSNTLWGNFIPFKNLVIDEKTYVKAIEAQTRIIEKNSDLDAKIKELQALNNQSLLFGVENIKQTEPVFNAKYEDLKAKASLIEKDINSNIESLKNVDDMFFNNFGVDSSFDANDFIDSDKVSSTPNSPEVRRNLRRKLNYLTRRMSYDVRSNQDKNLFIVDDSYDKDYDIMAFNKALEDGNGISLYQNDFTSVKDKIKTVAGLLNLEVFCDSQGNIRVRSPQYNRMPSSIFYKMMNLKDSKGIQVFPKFLSDLFGNQLDSLRENIEVIEDQIRLKCAILGYSTDESALDFIVQKSSANNGIGASFNFISNSNGFIADVSTLIKSIKPDSKSNVLEIKLRTQSSSNKIGFSNSQRFSTILETITKQNLKKQGLNVDSAAQLAGNTTVNSIINRIQTKTGQKISSTDYIVSNDVGIKDVELPTVKVIDVFKVTEELATNIRERQKAVKAFYNLLKNVVEFQSLDNNSDTSNNLLTPGIFGNKDIPEVFEHMIEDESYDDYGAGSGSRYIIKNSQIISANFSVNKPDFTAVQVVGLNTEFELELPGELNNATGSGNALVSAYAIDYDLWRNYGFQEASPVKIPFFTDKDSQCAPFASILLSQARKNLIRGTVVIAGNEYMQPGEVVYLEDRQMLFYVNAVSHDFTVGNSFTTTLTLTYGHVPGEYIPTTMDIIGKMIYRNKDNGSVVVHRQENSFNFINIGVIQRDPVSKSPMIFNTGAENEFINSFSSSNSQVINNLLYKTQYEINKNSTVGRSTKAKIEIRIYKDDKNPVNNDLLNTANTLIDILTGAVDGPKIQSGFNSESKNPTIPKEYIGDNGAVTIVNINSDDNRFISQSALDAARNQLKLMGNTSSDPSISEENDKLRKALFSSIIDCWVYFEPDFEVK